MPCEQCGFERPPHRHEEGCNQGLPIYTYKMNSRREVVGLDPLNVSYSILDVATTLNTCNQNGSEAG